MPPGGINLGTAFAAFSHEILNMGFLPLKNQDIGVILAFGAKNLKECSSHQRRWRA
jgi:hypothetical protein